MVSRPAHTHTRAHRPLAPAPLSACRLRAPQPFKMTAQQYSDCWRERVDRENNVLMESFKEPGDASASGAPLTSTALAAAEKDDDAVSVVGSLASHRSGASKRSNATKRSVARSDVSSNVSTNSATERKLKLLEEQLEKEQAKRKELEDLLKVKVALSLRLRLRLRLRLTLTLTLTLVLALSLTLTLTLTRPRLPKASRSILPLIDTSCTTSWHLLHYCSRPRSSPPEVLIAQRRAGPPTFIFPKRQPMLRTSSQASMPDGRCGLKTFSPSFCHIIFCFSCEYVCSVHEFRLPAAARMLSDKKLLSFSTIPFTAPLTHALSVIYKRGSSSSRAVS